MIAPRPPPHCMLFSRYLSTWKMHVGMQRGGREMKGAGIGLTQKHSLTYTRTYHLLVCLIFERRNERLTATNVILSSDIRTNSKRVLYCTFHHNSTCNIVSQVNKLPPKLYLQQRGWAKLQIHLYRAAAKQRKIQSFISYVLAAKK